MRCLLLLCLLFLFELGPAAAQAGPPLSEQRDRPLAPLDTSSPRATYQSFLAEMQKLEQLSAAYRADKSLAGAWRLVDAVERMSGVFDLSEVPPANRAKVGSTAFAYLYDILLRLPPIDPASIPGGTDADLPARWRLPDTDIVIAKVEKGEKAGDYLFSPGTVARLQAFRSRIIAYPPLRPSRYANWVVQTERWTGPAFTYDFLEALPPWFDDTLFGTPIWKVGLAVLIAAAVLFAVIAWAWLVRRLSRGARPVWRLLWRLSLPAVLAGLVWMAHRFVDLQVNLSGSFAEVEIVAATLALYAAAAWAAWIACFLLVEAIVASPAIPEGSYDANLLRLVARVGSLVAATLVLVYGASDLGVPALGLLTGLGVGGVALALAAQSTIENLFGGVSIFADRPFRIGDFIHYGEGDGVVEMIGPRSSRIRGLDGTLTTVPNGDLAKVHIVNYSKRNKCLFLHTLGLRYESSPAQLEWLLSELRRRVALHPLVERSPGFPRVRLTGLGDSSLDVEVRAYVLTANWNEFLEVQEALILDLMRAVEAAGSGFAFPSQTVYLGRDGGLDTAAKERAEAAAQRLEPAPAGDLGPALGPDHGEDSDHGDDAADGGGASRQ